MREHDAVRIDGERAVDYGADRQRYGVATSAGDALFVHKPQRPVDEQDTDLLRAEVAHLHTQIIEHRIPGAQDWPGVDLLMQGRVHCLCYAGETIYGFDVGEYKLKVCRLGCEHPR